MDDILYKTLVKYFKALSVNGYMKYPEVFKIIYMISIYKIIYDYFPSNVTENDYRTIEKSLYNIFGTSYLIPYPQYCNYNDMNKLHAQDATDLINAITHQIYEQNLNIDNFKEEVNSDLYVIKSTKVLKSEDSSEIEVDDIKI